MMNDKQISRLLRAAKAGLVIVLLYTVAQAVMVPFRLDTALKPKVVAGDEQSRSPVTVTTGNEGPADYLVIVENDLFAPGSGPADPHVSQAPDAMRSAEELGLKLVGAVAFPGNPSVSRAVIETSQTKSAQPYKIGDTVASATIESIKPDQVILRHAGQRRVLVLRTATAVTDQASPGADANSKATNPEKLATDNQPLPQTSARLNYVEAVFRKASIEPYVQEGRTEGLRITGLDQTPLTATFGLRNGDIVRNVNGQDLTSKQKAFQVLKKARTQSKLDIELLRGGKTKNLSFDL